MEIYKCSAENEIPIYYDGLSFNNQQLIDSIIYTKNFNPNNKEDFNLIEIGDFLIMTKPQMKGF